MLNTPVKNSSSLENILKHMSEANYISPMKSFDFRISDGLAGKNTQLSLQSLFDNQHQS